MAEFAGKHFTKRELEELERDSAVANEQEYGDHMQVYLRKAEMPMAEGGKKVIFQKFRREGSRYAYPYPPVYREPDADYICFAADGEIYSDYWKIQTVQNLNQETLEPYLGKYESRFELLQNQIQMGTVFGENPAENLLTAPALENLPMVKLDLENFVPTADEKGNFKYEKNPVYQKGKYGGRPLLLTIGVPVSNQIETIDRCLSHVKPLLDKLDAELVVIDTGSTDGTVEVCRSYGARVYEHPWHDNMSAARNEAIRHARGLWYLSIDDDEWFEDVGDILRFFKSGEYRKYTCATYIQRNYMDSAGTVFTDTHTPRMALITPELHFEGRIHDALLGGRKVCRYLSSYAHHYGFVNDRPDRVQAKFQRNAGILIQDVYEYPEDVRYLFQLANEYRVIGRTETALGLFAQCVSLSLWLGPVYRGRGSVGGLTKCLFDLKDERLFSWEDCLDSAFPLNTAELALNVLQRVSLADEKRKSAEEVLSYFERYEELLEEYRRDSDPEKRATFYGLPAVEREFLIEEAMAVGFCACLRLGKEERALELLEKFSLENVALKRTMVLIRGFEAGDAVYEALCGKLTAAQWEEWSGRILGIFGAGLANGDICQRMEKRFPELLARIEVSEVLSWLQDSKVARMGAVREKLVSYAFACAEEGRIFDEDISLPELALCAWVLKEAYVKKAAADVGGKVPSRSGEESQTMSGEGDQPAHEEESQTMSGEGDQPAHEEESQSTRGGENRPINEAENREGGMGLLQAYILAMGVFAERYYSPEQLSDPESRDVPPDVLAAYFMAAALADGRANSENVALLKQALAVCPPFHEEVRSILKELR